MKKQFFILFILLLTFSVSVFASSFTIETESMTLGGPYAGKISSPFTGIALYGNGDKGTSTNAFADGDGNYKINIIGASNKSNAAGVSLYVNNVKLKAFTFYGTGASTLEADIKITGLNQSSNTIVLLLETDNGSSDTFIDKITFTFQGAIVIKNPPVLPSQGAYNTGIYRNMLKEAGYTDTQINQKLENIWNQLFYGNSSSQAVYYPVGTDEAYILDTGNNDVRSEGMSYGMMICVQMNKQTEFNRLWKWAKTRMQHQSGARKGYFAWQMNTSGTMKDQNTASDGEEYFIMALMFASGRWGDGEGIYDYWKEANDILKNCMNKEYILHTSMNNLFNATEKQVVFTPYSQSALFTDPSYHLPAFYQLWSYWADTRRTFWRDMAEKSREMFPKFANAQTGLMPDYAEFGGAPRNEGGHGDFRFDAWRCAMNMAVDYAWFKPSENEVTLINRLHNFFASKGVDSYKNQYSLSGTELSGGDHSPGLVACNATGALASNQSVAWDFIDDFFNTGIPGGQYRYYDGMLYFMNYLHLSGNFRIYKPADILDIALDEQFNYTGDYLFLDNFENKSIGEEYYMRRTENSTANALVTADPVFLSNNSLHVLTGNYDEYLVMEFVLPEGRTLKNDYSQLEFDIYYTKKADDGNHNQDLKVDFDVIQGTPFFTTKTGDRANHGKWEHITVPLTSVTSGNTFKLYICIRTNKADFYIDNIKLKVNYSVPSMIENPETAKNNFFYSGNMLHFGNTPINNLSVFNLSGNLLVSKNNISSSLDISNLKSGVYIVRISANGQVNNMKIIK